MRKTYVPPSGDVNSTMAIVGEQPSFQEIRYRKPFVGPAGHGLDECLTIAKIPRHQLYITNVIKDGDKPLRSYIDVDSHNKWTISKEGLEYIEELGKELKALSNLNVVVAMGNISLIALCHRSGISNWRGSIIESTLIPNLKIVPTFHPATFIPPKFNFLNKPLIVEDLLRAAKESEYHIIRRTSRKVITKPSFSQAMSYLNHCYELGRRGDVIDIDIEVINKEVDCFSISFKSTESMSIPFRDSQGDYFDINQEYQIILMLARIIEDSKIKKRGANFIFDTQFLLHKYGIRPRGDLHCTQIAQKISFPDFNAGLSFVTTMHTDIPYYKEDGKQWIKIGAGSWEEWWTYNGMDSIATSDAHPKQIAELIKQSNLETYNRQRKLIQPLIYMSERGIKVDVTGMASCKEKEQLELESKAEELYSEVGYKINYNSPTQLMKYFYKDLSIKPYKKQNLKGQYSETINVDALKRIFRLGCKGSAAARILLDIRGLSKRISTYLNIGKVDIDGRYRSSYKPVGAETGRLSSGQTIFGTGGNQQNWPHDLLQYFLFDEGYLGYSFDLSQIENRLVAYVGGVLSQIEAFEKGIDLHRLTASIIIGKPYDQISSKDGSSSLGDGRQSERFWGKKGNHATNYDVGYKTFAIKNEMTETEAKRIIEQIHRGYPQIRGGYHVTIQNMLKKNRMVTNLMGRNRLFLGPIIPSYPNVPASACYETYREAYAHLPQSTTADKINEHGVEYIFYNQDLFRPIELLAQIHDSVVFQIPLSIPWTEQARMLILIKSSLEQPLFWKGIKIDTPVDLSIGLNMSKELMKEIKHKDFPNDEADLAHKLEVIYNEICAEQSERISSCISSTNLELS
jgi:uracil-DNA glycosylase family 4